MVWRTPFRSQSRVLCVSHYLRGLAFRRSRIIWLTDFPSSHDAVQDATGYPQNAVPATGNVPGADIDDSRFASEHPPYRVTADVQHVSDFCD